MYKLSDAGFYTDDNMLIHFQKGMENEILVLRITELADHF